MPAMVGLGIQLMQHLVLLIQVLEAEAVVGRFLVTFLHHTMALAVLVL
jgi:hypothetical protein